jgi:hypothetical protein
MPAPNFTLLNAQTTTNTGNPFEPPLRGLRTFGSTLTCTSGNCTATVLFEVSMDKVAWVTMATTTYSSAASPQADGFVSDSTWPYVRASVTAISGTGAAVSAYLNMPTP